MAASVDVILAGGQAGVQTRERQGDGMVLKSQTVHQMPRVIFQRTGSSESGKKKKEPSRRRDSQVATSSRDEMEEEEEEGGSIDLPPDLPDFPMPDADDGLACRKAWATRKKVEMFLAREGSVAPLRPNNESLLRVMPFEIESERMFGVMKSLGLLGAFVVAYRLEEADCVIGLRPKVKAAAELRRAAKLCSVPIYALKDIGASTLARAVKALLAQGPVSQGKKQSGNGLESVDLVETSPSSNFAAPGGTLESEALEEVSEALSIVIPTGQSVELLPRSADIIQAQIAFVKRNVGISHELVGSGNDIRLRILPS